ncbi:hypothetical protein KCP73_01230 [Salmonella enterica subsp. enterica]|nr:hypothetical protein KCP73_01230 [Salmonella enterica subsp. enterica]
MVKIRRGQTGAWVSPAYGITAGGLAPQAGVANMIPISFSPSARSASSDQVYRRRDNTSRYCNNVGFHLPCSRSRLCDTPGYGKTSLNGRKYEARGASGTVTYRKDGIRVVDFGGWIVRSA